MGFAAKKSLIDRITTFVNNKASASFDDLVFDVCRFQYENMPAMRAYWQSLGAIPNKIGDVFALPPVALAVFKRQVLFAGNTAIKTFRTSGTSGKGRGSSPFDQDDLNLMDASILTNATDNLFRDGIKTRFFMLVPSPDEAPEVIMAHGMARIATHFGLDRPFYAVRGGKFVGPAAVEYLQHCVAEQVPVTLIGGSFGFVNFVEGLQEKLDGIILPPGSRMLDAGGFKGRSRELDRHRFLAMVRGFFGLSAEQCYNLYGLTELGSQFYSRGHEPKRPAHWTRVRVCDPLTLKDVAPGEQGVPVLYDLANVSRPAVILTDDIAVSHGDEGFEVIGRASGSAPRGCSLQLEHIR